MSVDRPLTAPEIITLHGGGNPFVDVAQPAHSAVSDIKPANEDIINRLPRTTDGELTSAEAQKPIVEQLRNSPDRVWHMDAFEKDGKYNCLRITPAGQVFLDVIKPGVHFPRVVQLAGHISQESIIAVRKELLERPKEWQKKLEQGFLQQGTTTHSADTQFDLNGATRGGAVFVFDRTLDLGVVDTASGSNAILRWIGRHTNPETKWGPFKVEDIFRFEWESLPTN